MTMAPASAYRRLAALTAVVLLAAPAVTFAADIESAEGNCNDEMSESVGCGTTGMGSSRTTAYQAPTYQQYPQTYSSYTPTLSPQTYPGYTPTYQTYQPYQQSSQYYYPNTQSQYQASPVNYYASGYGSTVYQPTPYPYYGSSSYSPYSQTQTQYYYPASYAQNSYTAGSSFSPRSGPPGITATPTGTYDFYGNPLCVWSDYSGAAMPCSSDPQQWILDPYTGRWY